MRNFFIPLAVSLGVHVGLAILLFVGVALPQKETRIKPKVEYINATLVVMEKSTKTVKQPKKSRPTPPKPKPKPKEPEKKPEPKAEPKKPVEKKPEEPSPEEQQRQDLLDQQRDEIAAALDEEFYDDPAWDEEQTDDAELSDEEKQVRTLGMAIQRAIIARWSRPPSARNGMEVELIINLLPTGDIVGVQRAKSSGNRAFDLSAETAVKKVGRFPEVQELRGNMVFERNFRQFRLTFRPEDLRK